MGDRVVKKNQIKNIPGKSEELGERRDRERERERKGEMIGGRHLIGENISIIKTPLTAGSSGGIDDFVFLLLLGSLKVRRGNDEDSYTLRERGLFTFMSSKCVGGDVL